MSPRPLALLLAAAFFLTGAASPAPAANQWLSKPVLNIAHQGGEDEFPSNTLYAFKKAVRVGADMIELDIGVTLDERVVVLHDTTVNGKTNGKGTVISKTLRQLRRLDAAYWYSAGAEHYARDKPRRAYRFRGIATGRKPAPTGFRRTDFRIPTLAEVLAAFPRTPINIEIKGRTPKETDEEYVANAEVLAALLRGTKRTDLIVTSFKQKAVDRFHEIAPAISVAPGIDGAANFLLAGGSPGDGVETLDLPMTYEFGGSTLQIASPENIRRAHDSEYAWHSWFSNQDVDGPAGWSKLVEWCADGIMTAQPRRLERFLAENPAPAVCG